MRKDESGDVWIVARFFLGFANQYAADVVANVLDGKTGRDIYISRSSFGEYVGAGIAAMISGSVLIQSVVQNVVTETIDCVNQYTKGNIINVTDSLKTVAYNTAIGALIGKGTDISVKNVKSYISDSMPRNYSSFAGEQYKKKSEYNGEGDSKEVKGNYKGWQHHI